VADNPTCYQKKWWTSHRFAPEALNALDTAIDQLKAHPAQPVHLIGFSGGAAHALLLAAKRGDVASVRTVAGNVAPHITNDVHNVTATPAALTPLDYPDKLTNIPQVHFIGGKDRIIRPEITQAYTDGLAHQGCTQVISLPQASHLTGWAERWATLLATPPVCR
jgi:dienelactone hydrolase